MQVPRRFPVPGGSGGSDKGSRVVPQGSWMVPSGSGAVVPEVSGFWRVFLSFPPIPDVFGGSGAGAGVVRVGPRFWCRFRGRFLLQCTQHDTASVK